MTDFLEFLEKSETLIQPDELQLVRENKEPLPPDAGMPKLDYRIFVIYSQSLKEAYVGITKMGLKQRMSSIKSSFKRYLRKPDQAVWASHYDILKQSDCQVKLVKEMNDTRYQASLVRAECVKSLKECGYTVQNGVVGSLN